MCEARVHSDSQWGRLDCLRVALACYPALASLSLSQWRERRVLLVFCCSWFPCTTHLPRSSLLMVSCMTCVAVKVCSAEVHAVRSSACREFVTLGGRVLTMSFTHRRNRAGERTLPCGIPSLNLISAEQSITLHSRILWWRKLLIQLFFTLDLKLLLSTVSTAVLFSTPSWTPLRGRKRQPAAFASPRMSLQCLKWGVQADLQCCNVDGNLSERG